MATVYGYFRSDDEARLAADRLTEVGVIPTVVAQPDTPNYVDETVMHTGHSRHRKVIRIAVITAALVAVLGAVAWTVIPGLWGKAVIAGPLLTALYGVAVGIVIATVLEMRRNDMSSSVPDNLVKHTSAQSVLIIQTPEIRRAEEIEQMLESEGAVEVIHRAA
jgi:hypothetical protein